MKKIRSKPVIGLRKLSHSSEMRNDVSMHREGLTFPLPISQLCENYLPLPISHLCEFYMCTCINCNGDISLYA